MKAIELKTKDTAELQSILKEQEIVLGRLQFELANKTLKKSSDLRKARVTIARLQTFLRQRVTK